MPLRYSNACSRGVGLHLRNRPISAYKQGTTSLEHTKIPNASIHAFNQI